MHAGKNRTPTCNTEEEPRLWESNATPWDPSGWTAALPKSHSTLRILQSVMLVVYTAKVTDHHGSDFSSLALPPIGSEPFSSGQSTSWNLYASEYIDVFIVGDLIS